MTCALAIILRLDRTTVALNLQASRENVSFESGQGEDLPSFVFVPEKILYTIEKDRTHFLRAKRNSGIRTTPPHSQSIFAQYYLLLNGEFLPTLKIEELALPAFFRCRSTKRLRGPECGARCDKKRIKYLPLDRTIRLMKIPIVTPQVLRREIFRRSSFRMSRGISSRSSRYAKK